ncbi:MAG TPA: hypothetical protein VJV78_16015 [Polyangiales bacterium]|nr:hypothetical protein [Polyangiales bacterium]
MAETVVKYAAAQAPGAHPALDAHQRAYAPAVEMLAEKKLGQRPAPPRVEAGDVQGLVLRGYGALPFCRHVLLQLRDPQQGRAWLRQLIPRIARGAPAAEQTAVQVAFTHAGLAALGLAEDTLQAFSREFIAGITGSHRSRFLGDIGDSAPEKWRWGGPNNAAVHAVLMLYGDTPARLSALRNELSQNWLHCDLIDVHTLEAAELSDREHFGFVDGISQPAIEGYHPADSRLHTIKAGEFLLGYPNEYSLYTDRPLVESFCDPFALLPLDVEGSPRRDLGKNGTYMVFRQLRQDVPAFRDTLDALSKNPDGTLNAHARELLAAQLIGRWPSGTSLIEAPYRDDASKARQNEFDYHHRDPEGLKCPIGAHVRRANPRDALAPHPGSDDSLSVNRRHRLIRRGRAYGSALPEGARDDADRGLLFIALNANISRQFEFVQHSWLIDPRFNGLYDQADPIIGSGAANQFVVPGDPVRRRCTGLPRFVSVAGGAYFFMPGIRALHFLAESMP